VFVRIVLLQKLAVADSLLRLTRFNRYMKQSKKNTLMDSMMVGAETRGQVLDEHSPKKWRSSLWHQAQTSLFPLKHCGDEE
jgi:hypothetical protein